MPDARWVVRGNRPGDAFQRPTRRRARAVAPLDVGRPGGGLGIVLSGSLSGLFGTWPAPARRGERSGSGVARAGFGPLVDDSKGLLSLPAGFSYPLVARSGVTGFVYAIRGPFRRQR